MKRTVSTLLLLMMASQASARIGRGIRTMEAEAEYADSARTEGIAVLSDDGAGIRLFQDILPPSPQAAAITRYAEYPVHHTTGIPDITVPLYEIHMGDYTLPVSISYHASGSRPDQMPTCVGLGWTLDAGGAVTRTILGKPDMYETGILRQDYTYFDRTALSSLLAEVGDHGDAVLESVVSHIVGDHTSPDTESDRYIYRVGDKSGVFRFSHREMEFIPLNNSNDCIEGYSHGYGLADPLEFRIYSTDNNDYVFAEEEATGVKPTDGGYTEHAFVTAWYISEIKTPRGDIRFTYERGDEVSVGMHDVHATAGPRPENESPEAYSWKYTVRAAESDYTMSYGQKLVSRIEWDGNRIEFNYVDEHPHVTLKRLTCMRVYNSCGELLKKVDFDNTDNWPTGDSRTGRRLLGKVTDSEKGIWTFGYDKDMSLPSLPLAHSPACEADWWGFWNAARPSSSLSVFTESQHQWLRSGVSEHNLAQNSIEGSVHTRSRKPDLACTRAGVLNRLTFPTGGLVEYEYELNSFGGTDYGGLRVKAQTVYESQSSAGRRTTYQYGAPVLTAEDPETLSRYRTYEQIVIPKMVGNPDPISFRTVSAFPVSPVTGAASPVLYAWVRETRNDGSSVTYAYDETYLDPTKGIPYEGYHPSLYEQSIMDYGVRQPLLLTKTVCDSGGTAVFRESYEWVKKEPRSFSTGVRTACPYFEHEYPPNRYVPVTLTARNIASFGMLQYRESNAYVNVALMRTRKTEDLVTGFSRTAEYGYDELFRTMSPRYESETGSDGVEVRTVHTYPFDRNDEECEKMVQYTQADYPVESRKYSGDHLVSITEYGYIFHNELFHPAWTSTWSSPTAAGLQSPPAKLPERWRVSAYNGKGRPLSIKVNDTDVTSFTWNTAGNLLLSSTAPGGLTTTYTHRPLFGLSSVKLPNGHTTSYSYNSAGMLSSVSDASGVTESYAYSLIGHPSMNTDGNSVSRKTHLDAGGSNAVLTRQYHSRLGLPTTLLRGGLNTTGEYVFSTTGHDALGRPTDNILPGAGGTAAAFRTYTQILADARSTYGEEYVKTQTVYDALDRPVKVTTPGDAWHAAGKARTIQYISNAANSVRLYRAPMNDITLVEDGYYAAKTLRGVRAVDEDGNEMTVYTDRLGRKVLERRGPESKKGQNDTYFVYNALGQLRYVLSPGYELSGFKEKFAYEYRYDEHGNVVKKFIPGAGYTRYWYDRSGRLAFMQDPNLRGRNLHRFFLYDRAGRLAIQGVSGSCNRSIAVNFADWSGKAGGFMQTGYTLTDASRLQQVTLETVNYYDDHTFASVLDKDLYRSGAQSAQGLQTGSVVYGSDGKKSMTAVYYDIRGNIIESRERTAFGTLRTTVNTYTYTGQPLKSTVTEGSVTTITENTYHAASGLLTATDVTVNGVKQRVSAIEYDDLGRIASVTRGAPTKSGGKVSYRYNLHGQTTEISGPGFSQNLYYADGPGKKLYNGSVSAMIWTMGTDTRVRGYKYSYNGYGWLTAAEYGENTSLGSNPNRYTERFLDFMPNGGVRRLQRHGLKADGVYGKVDNLHIYYDGNRITGVLDDAGLVTQNGSMDFPVSGREMEMEYNGWGALVRDESRDITDISYDRFGNSLRISYSDGSYTENVYSTAGEKLKATHATSLNGTVTGKTTTEYRGNVIYRDGKVEMVLFPGGYATINGTAVTFHYYTQDYLGNNRAVINGSTGAIEQTTAYYPYGAVIADLGNPHGGQPYKFGGKELITANGLNEYDFGARQYYPALAGFTKLDQHCENYYWLSPYLFCANNPVNRVDPTGKDSWTLDEMGNIMTLITTDKYDEIITVNRKNEEVNIWKGEYGSIIQKPNMESKENSILTFSCDNDETGLSIFEFLADNSSVEWSVLQMGLSDDNIENIVTTSHDKKSEAGATAFIVENILDIDIRNAFHSHPSGIEYPSGLSWDPENPGDVQFAGWVDRINKKTQATYKIYNPLKKMYTEYNRESTHFDFSK